MANRWGEKWKHWQTLFSWAPESLQMVTAAMKLRQLLLGRKAITYLDSMLKAKTSLFWQKHLSGFSSSHIWMGELNHKEGWALKNWYFQALVLEKTFKSPLDSKEIKPVNPKGQPQIFIGRTDVEAEAPIIQPRDLKSWLTGKYPDTGENWRHEEMGMTEEEIVGWHHWLNGPEFE